MAWVWEDSDRDYDYRFLRSGELEFQGRGGRYRIISGCSIAGIFELEDRLEEMQAIAQEAPDELTIDDLYRNHPRFQYLCDRVLHLNGIDLDWVTPKQMGWLMFNRLEDGAIVEAPLQILNKPPKPRHPSGKGGSSGKTDKVAMIAAIASHCGGNLDLAYKLATSESARELISAMDEVSWLQKSPEERRKAEFKDWAKEERTKLRARRGALHPKSGEKANPPK